MVVGGEPRMEDDWEDDMKISEDGGGSWGSTPASPRERTFQEKVTNIIQKCTPDLGRKKKKYFERFEGKLMRFHYKKGGTEIFPIIKIEENSTGIIIVFWDKDIGRPNINRIRPNKLRRLVKLPDADYILFKLEHEELGNGRIK